MLILDRTRAPLTVFDLTTACPTDANSCLGVLDRRTQRIVASKIYRVQSEGLGVCASTEVAFDSTCLALASTSREAFPAKALTTL
jgi:hypothetical protein